MIKRKNILRCKVLYIFGKEILYCNDQRKTKAFIFKDKRLFASQRKLNEGSK